ncbi:hypothetical protein WJX72_004378 [[Myrmecia] bisecta]|uniref:PROP1-like PPR domain-containing protein n=1 Tax=[Myrmecia] bisecta TaxID=41462 RepID=A0AAW1R5S5_9CHLO
MHIQVRPFASGAPAPLESQPPASLSQSSGAMRYAIRKGDAAGVVRSFDREAALKAPGLECANQFDTFLEACAKLGNAGDALAAVELMQQQRVLMGYIAHGSVLLALCKAGRLPDAWAYLSGPSCAQRTSAIMCNTVLAAANQAGNAGIAADCLQLMRDRQVAWDGQTWGNALRLQAVRQDPAGLEEHWQLVQQTPFANLAGVQAAYIIALTTCGKLDKASETLQAALEAYKQAPRDAGIRFPSARTQRSDRPRPEKPPADGAHSFVSNKALEKGIFGRWATEQAHEVRTNKPVHDLRTKGATSRQGGVNARQGDEHQMRVACHAVVYAAEHELDSALAHAVLSQMREAGVRPDTQLYNCVLRMRVDNLEAPPALEATLDDMQALGLQPDQHSFTALIRAYAQQKDMAGAQAAAFRMQAAGVPLGIHAYNALLEAYAAAKDLQASAELYAQMRSQGIAPDRCTFTELFKASIGPGGDSWQDADGAAPTDWEAYEGERQFALHARMQARQAAVNKLEAWVADFEAMGLQHNAGSLTALTQAYGSNCQVAPMLKLIYGAWDTPGHAKPPIQACNAAIAACSRVGDVDTALDLQERTEKEGLQSNAYIYTSLIAGCALAKRTELAYHLLKKMRAEGLQPMLWTYNALINAECHADNLAAALKLVDRLEDQGLQPDDSTWRTLLRDS